MIKIEGKLAVVFAARLIYEIEKKTNERFSDMILKNERLLNDLAYIFEKSLEQCAQRLNQEKIGKPHKELTKNTE